MWAQETIYHIFLECPNYNHHRLVLQSQIKDLNVPLNMRNLLGGGEFDFKIQIEIVEIVSNYLFRIRKLYTL